MMKFNPEQLATRIDEHLKSINNRLDTLDKSVEVLKADMIQRRLIYKILKWVLSIIVTVGTILFNTFIHK